MIYRRSAPFMGTTWHIALYSDNSETANAAFQLAWAKIDEIERDLTNYDNNSELNRLCNSSPHEQPVPVGSHLWKVLTTSDALSRKTAGAFDVTVGPFTKLWRRARRRGELPSTDSLQACRASVGFQAIGFLPKTQSVRLTKPGMLIDLGGIAKGYAVDETLRALAGAGIRSALVNGGGDLAVSDPPPGKPGWEVKLAGLDAQTDSAKETIMLTQQAIATSGDAWQFLEINGKRYSHILDPRTGIGTSQRITVTVIAPTCMQADGWASALAVLDPTTGLSLIAKEAGIQARLILVEQDVPRELRSAGFSPARERSALNP